jgi:uncharacterized protein YndB with AHSA1/START domain
MPMKKADPGRRWVEMEFLVPGTPEQVWQAVVEQPKWSLWLRGLLEGERIAN